MPPTAGQFGALYSGRPSSLSSVVGTSGATPAAGVSGQSWAHLLQHSVVLEEPGVACCWALHGGSVDKQTALPAASYLRLYREEQLQDVEPTCSSNVEVVTVFKVKNSTTELYTDRSKQLLAGHNFYFMGSSKGRMIEKNT